MRRVYRAHEILDISVDTSGAEMTVDWSFRYRDTSPADTPVSRGEQQLSFTYELLCRAVVCSALLSSAVLCCHELSCTAVRLLACR